MSITDKNKIVIIGAGNVGEAVCYTLMVRRQASEIVLVDINEEHLHHPGYCASYYEVRQKPHFGRCI